MIRSENGKKCQNHVVLVHEKFANRKEDKYIINLVSALRYTGSVVTILTSCYSKDESANVAEFAASVTIRYVASWIPNSVCGFLKPFMVYLKATWTAFAILINPPKPRPSIFIVDNCFLLSVLKRFGDVTVFYLEHFKYLRYCDDLLEQPFPTPSLFEVKWMKYADEIIVENECYGELFQRLYPAVARVPRILTTCIDTGLWNEPIIKIERIIPDLRKDNMIFLVTGKYRKSSNFLLAIEAFELLFDTTKESLKDRLHLVVAGHCKSLEETLFYNHLVEDTKPKLCASRVTFLRQLPTIHHKTLLSEAAIVILPARNFTCLEFLIAAMSLGKPIIAANQGIAPTLLEHRVSGILVEADPNAIATTLRKLIVSPSLRMFLGEMSKQTFDTNFSFSCFSQKVASLINQYEIANKTLI